MRLNPFLLSAALTLPPLTLTLTPRAFAQPDASNDPDTIEARARFKEGVKAFEAKKYEEARVAFKQAYALKPVPDVLRNLGTVEIRAGYLRDGARHLSEFLNGNPTLTATESSDIEKELSKAQQKLGRMLIAINVSEAQITVGDEPVGSWVMSQPWYVEPGEYTVLAKKPGYAEARQSVITTAGQVTTVSLSLHPIESDAAPGAPSRSGATSAATATSTFDEKSSSGRSIVPAIVGGSVVAAGLAVGIGFRLAASSRRSDAEGMALEGNDQCATNALEVCTDLRDAYEAIDRDKNISTAGFIVAGAGALSVLGYYLWPRSKQPGDVTPIATASPRYAGFGVTGAF